MRNLKLQLTILLCLCAMWSAFSNVFSSNGKFFAEVSNNKLKVWNIETGKPLYTLDLTIPLKAGDRYQINLSKSDVITLSFDGRYVIMVGTDMHKFYGGDAIEKSQVTSYIDLSTSKLVTWQIQEIKYKSKIYYSFLQNENKYVEYYSKSKDETFIKIYEFNNESESLVEELIVKIKRKSKDYSTAIGRPMIIEKDGKTYYGVFYDTNGKLYNINKLTAKPIKMNLPEGIELYHPHSKDYSLFLDFKKRIILKNGAALKSATNLNGIVYIKAREYAYAFNEETTVFIELNKSTGAIRHFDYINNKYVKEFSLYTENPRQVFMSPNGIHAVIDFASGMKIFNLITGETGSTLAGNDEYIGIATQQFKANNFDEALVALNKVTEKAYKRTDYNQIGFKLYGALLNYPKAVAHLKALDFEIEVVDYFLAAESLANQGDSNKAVELLSEYQKYSIRKSAKELDENEEFKTLDSNEAFQLLVTNTKAIDELTSKDSTTDALKRGVGLYDIYIQIGYNLLNDYEMQGVDAALLDAKPQFANARTYALTPNAKALTYTIMANAYTTANNVVDAIEEYNNALYENPDVSYFYVEFSMACQEIKGYIEEELRTMKQVTWPKALTSDYSKMDETTKELTTAYIKEFPNDPMGYYIRAMSEITLIRDFYKRRMKDANTAIKLFKKNGIAVPEYCIQMADRNFGVKEIVPKKSTGTMTIVFVDCEETCNKCHGRGSSTLASQCDSCSGSGKSGPCGSCNGRGRKYDTTRNQEICYNCSGSGKLPCYTCSSTGRKASYNNCTKCGGSGKHCGE